MLLTIHKTFFNHLFKLYFKSFANLLLSSRAIKQETVPDIKKPKLEDTVDGNPDEAIMKEQNKIMFKYRDKLKNELRKEELTELLQYNGQEVPVGSERVTNLCFYFYTMFFF